MAWHPLATDALDCADMLLCKLIPGRPCVREPHNNGTRRPYKVPMDRALSLLAPGCEGQSDIKLVEGWEDRLRKIGVDPEILRVIDEETWRVQVRRWEATARELKERHRVVREQKANNQLVCQYQQRQIDAIKEERGTVTDFGDEYSNTEAPIAGFATVGQQLEYDQRERDNALFGRSRPKGW